MVVQDSKETLALANFQVQVMKRRMLRITQDCID